MWHVLVMYPTNLAVVVLLGEYQHQIVGIIAGQPYIIYSMHDVACTVHVTHEKSAVAVNSIVPLWGIIKKAMW